MKNVLLLGDSICAGYKESVKRTLAGKANVYFTEDNCRFASYLLRYIHEYRELIEGGEADVVHWNAGLWDCLRLFEEEPHTPIEMYAYYIDRVCVRIKKVFPHAKVVFATSTRIQSERMSRDYGKNFCRYNEDIEAYNEAAVAVVKKHGFLVDDLYATSAALPGEAHSDAVHYYTPIGTEAFTNQVLSCIVPLLGIDEKITYREELYTDKPVGI